MNPARGIPLFLVTALVAAGPVDDQVRVLEEHAKDPFEQRRREGAIRNLGKIGSPKAVQALVRLLEDPYAHIRDVAVSALISTRKSGQRDACFEVLQKALRQRNPETRRHVATALGLMGRASVGPALRKALAKEKNPETTAALAQALARLKDPTALPALEAKARKPFARAACIRALATFKEGMATALRHAGDADPWVRAAVADACARRRHPWPDALWKEVGEPDGIALAQGLGSQKPDGRRHRATGLLRHPSWRVRAAALDAVERLRDASLLDLVVERLEQEKGRLRHDAWHALRRLTGKEIGPEPELWKRILPLSELPLPKKPGDLLSESTSTTYFGLPVVSERIAFVFDVSGSMRDDGKIETARRTFAQTAAKLGPDQRYDLFVHRYPSRHPPKPTLERTFGKLRSGNVKKASSWLRRQPAKGWGAIYDALLDAIHDPEVDTIYLLSDGRPSRGTVVRDFRIHQEFPQRNRWRQVRVHTILMGTKGVDRAFMKRLAEDSGGVAVDAQGRRLR